MTNRNTFIDFIKGISIFLVILAHTLDPSYWYSSTLHVSIISMCMPFFIGISGYLFYTTNRNSKTTKDIIIKKLRTIGLPIVSYSILYMAYRMLWAIISKKTSLYSIIEDIPSSIFMDLWFLWALLFVTVTTLYILKHRWFSNGWSFILFITVLSVFIPNVSILNRCFYLFPYFLMGYYMNEISIQRISLKVHILLFSVCLLGFLLLLPYMYSETVSIYDSGLYILTDNPMWQLQTDFRRYLIGLCGSVVMLYAAFVVYHYCPITHKHVEYLGRYSLPLYCFPFFTSSPVDKYIPLITSNLTLVIIIECIAVIATTIPFIMIAKRNNLLTLLFLGGRK